MIIISIRTNEAKHPVVLWGNNSRKKDAELPLRLVVVQLVPGSAGQLAQVFRAALVSQDACAHHGKEIPVLVQIAAESIVLFAVHGLANPFCTARYGPDCSTFTNLVK